MKLSVSIDESDLARLKKTLSPARVDAATRQALNRTLLNLRTTLTKRIGQHISLRARDIKGTMSDGRATNTGLEATLTVRFDPVSMRLYPHSVSRKRGVSVSLLRGQGRTRFNRAFVVQSLGGSIYERVGEKVVMGKGRYAGKRRQQISKLHGPSVRAVAEPILAELTDSGWVAERMAINLDAALNHAVTKARS